MNIKNLSHYYFSILFNYFNVLFGITDSMLSSSIHIYNYPLCQMSDKKKYLTSNSKDCFETNVFTLLKNNIHPFGCFLLFTAFINGIIINIV